MGDLDDLSLDSNPVDTEPLDIGTSDMDSDNSDLPSNDSSDFAEPSDSLSTDNAPDEIPEDAEGSGDANDAPPDETDSGEADTPDEIPEDVEGSGDANDTPSDEADSGEADTQDEIPEDVEGGGDINDTPSDEADSGEADTPDEIPEDAEGGGDINDTPSDEADSGEADTPDEIPEDAEGGGDINDTPSDEADSGEADTPDEIPEDAEGGGDINDTPSDEADAPDEIPEDSAGENLYDTEYGPQVGTNTPPVCPICGQNPCICGTNRSGDNPGDNPDDNSDYDITCPICGEYPCVCKHSDETGSDFDTPEGDRSSKEKGDGEMSPEKRDNGIDEMVGEHSPSINPYKDDWKDFSDEMAEKNPGETTDWDSLKDVPFAGNDAENGDAYRANPIQTDDVMDDQPLSQNDLGENNKTLKDASENPAPGTQDGRFFKRIDDNQNQLTNDEKTPLGIDSFQKQSDLDNSIVDCVPELRRGAVDLAYENAPEGFVNALNDCASEMKPIQDTGYSINKDEERVKDGCYYSPYDGCVHMNEQMKDDEYAEVLPHEMTHFMDDQRGWESRSDAFKNAVNSDIASMDRSTPEGRQRFNDMLDDAFSTGACDDRNVSDIINAMFGEKGNDPEIAQRFDDELTPRYTHDDDYWTGTDSNNIAHPEIGLNNRLAEIYANNGAITASNDRISNNFLERWFGNTYNQFNKFYGIKGQ